MCTQPYKSRLYGKESYASSRACVSFAGSLEESKDVGASLPSPFPFHAFSVAAIKSICFSLGILLRRGSRESHGDALLPTGGAFNIPG